MYGTVISMKPFYITYATEKETVLCMCKLCLNARLLFNPLMENGKSSGGTTFSSITEFFMDSCQCPRSINGYYQYACCQGKCRACKNIDLPQINALTTDVLRTFYQFEITKTKYQCKKTGI